MTLDFTFLNNYYCFKMELYDGGQVLYEYRPLDGRLHLMQDRGL